MSGVRETLSASSQPLPFTPHPTSLRSATFSRKGRREKNALFFSIIQRRPDYLKESNAGSR
jgi:hypothetical protein